MKRIALLILILLQFVTYSSYGQLWCMVRGLATDEVAWAVDADSSGNVYWAIEEKNQWPFWYYNIVLFKISPDGQLIWQTNSWDNGTGFNDIAFKATVKGNNVYLSGRRDSTGSPNSGDASVLCYSVNNGSFNWAYSYNPVPDYGYEEIDGLIVKPDGIYLSGWKQQQNTNDLDFLIQKISLSGQLVWSNTWDYNSLGKCDGANGHMAMDNNYMYVAGHVNKANVTSIDGDASLVCFNRINGAYQWHVTWGGSLYDDALGMTMSSDSMIYVTGYTGSFGNGSQNYLNKYSRTGQLKWSRIWGGSGTEDTRSLVSDGDSIIYVVGTTSSFGSGAKDIFVLKYDTAGTLIDTLFWGGAYDEIAKDVVRYDDYLYITGETKSFGNGQINGDRKTDGMLLKINGRTMQAPDTSMIFTNMLRNEIKLTCEIFPNPCNNFFMLNLKEYHIFEKLDFALYDISGRLIILGIISTANQKINCSDIENGIYFIQVRKDAITIGSNKLIIQQ